MMLQRKFEEKLQELFALNKLHGTAHLDIGEEAVSCGVLSALKKQDYVFSMHRGHGQAIAKGLDINAMMAEVFGKKNGTNHGTGGSMHISDADNFFYGIGGVLGANAAVATGTALAIKRKNEKDRISAVFYGDGSSNEGAVFEALNLASTWDLPILFCCVNNTYGMSTHISKAMHDTDLKKRALPFGIEVAEVDGNDVIEVLKAANTARKYIFDNSRPYMLVLNTYRISGHSKSDKNLYRSEEEINEWKEKCPIKAFITKLKNKGIEEKIIDGIDKQTTKIIEDAVEFAKKDEMADRSILKSLS